MAEIAVYSTLFFVAFGAATLLPLQSEAVLVAFLLKGYTPWLLIVLASLGNILGSIVNWYLGTRVEHFKDRKWFPFEQKQINKAQRWYHRYGRWTLLLSWTPIIGDPLTFIAGVMRERLHIFIALVTVAKLGRYIVIYLTFDTLQ